MASKQSVQFKNDSLLAKLQQASLVYNHCQLVSYTQNSPNRLAAWKNLVLFFTLFAGVSNSYSWLYTLTHIRWWRTQSKGTMLVYHMLARAWGCSSLNARTKLWKSSDLTCDHDTPPEGATNQVPYCDKVCWLWLNLVKGRLSTQLIGPNWIHSNLVHSFLDEHQPRTPLGQPIWAGWSLWHGAALSHNEYWMLV